MQPVAAVTYTVDRQAGLSQTASQKLFGLGFVFDDQDLHVGLSEMPGGGRACIPMMRLHLPLREAPVVFASKITNL